MIPEVSSAGRRGWLTRFPALRWLLLATILLASGAYLFRVSQAKAFWGDESLTFYTVHGRTLRSLLQFQASTPVVLEPPANDILLWLCARCFGYSKLVFRLPSLLLFLMLQALLYRLTSLLGGYRAGLMAAAALIGVRFTNYGAEARPYALLSMLTLAGLLLWYEARREAPHARWAQLLLVPTVALAVTCQFYGGLMMLPILAAELVCARAERRPLRWVTLALLAGAAGFAVLLDVPFLHAVRAYRPPATHQINVNAQQIWVTYVEGFFAEPRLLVALHLPLLSYARVALLVGVLCSVPLPRGPLPGAGTLPVRRALWAAFLVLTAYPAIALLLAVFVTHTWYSRYAIQCILALVALLAVAVTRLLQRLPSSAFALLACAGAVFVSMQCSAMLGLQRDATEAIVAPYRVSAPVRTLLAQHPDAPIYLTIDECLLFPFFGEQAYQPRIRCLYSEGLEDRYDHSVMSSLTAIVMADHTDLGLPATCFQTLQASGGGFLAFNPHPWLLWVPESLQAAHGSSTGVGPGFGGTVLQTTMPPGGAGAAPCTVSHPTA